MRNSIKPHTWLMPVSAFRSSGSGVVNTPSAPVPSVLSPPMTAAAPVSSGGNIDLLSTAIYTLNTNPYLIGCLMLLLNLGGRFLSLELTKKQEAFLQQSWLRPLIFFTVIFVATRNLAVAFWITVFFFFIIWIVANENSPFCLIPSWRKDAKAAETSSIQQQQYETNMSFIQQQQQQQQQQNQA